MTDVKRRRGWFSPQFPMFGSMPREKEEYHDCFYLLYSMLTPTSADNARCHSVLITTGVILRWQRQVSFRADSDRVSFCADNDKCHSALTTPDVILRWLPSKCHSALETTRMWRWRRGWVSWSCFLRINLPRLKEQESHVAGKGLWFFFTLLYHYIFRKGQKWTFIQEDSARQAEMFRSLLSMVKTWRFNG